MEKLFKSQEANPSKENLWFSYPSMKTPVKSGWYSLSKKKRNQSKVKDNRDNQDNKDNRDNKDNQDNRDNRDNKDNKDNQESQGMAL